ncbi:hypothetical protein BT69DRAFT_1286463 [Atractiella rhizophila]|nr:hypothetical protein BT69DRAFT_1286463 [Atractiella rhizophila]
MVEEVTPTPNPALNHIPEWATNLHQILQETQAVQRQLHQATGEIQAAQQQLKQTCGEIQAGQQQIQNEVQGFLQLQHDQLHRVEWIEYVNKVEVHNLKVARQQTDEWTLVRVHNSNINSDLLALAPLNLPYQREMQPVIPAVVFEAPPAFDPQPLVAAPHDLFPLTRGDLRRLREENVTLLLEAYDVPGRALVTTAEQGRALFCHFIGVRF